MRCFVCQESVSQLAPMPDFWSLGPVCHPCANAFSVVYVWMHEKPFADESRLLEAAKALAQTLVDHPQANYVID